MASTNHTTNYDLSQYIATDKPTYLVDYNNDMLKIDTQMHTNATAAATAQTAAETADSKAVTADGKAVTAQSSAASAQTAADNANTHIGTMANLETSEKTNLVAAINEVIGYFNLEATDTISYNSMSVSGGTLTSGEVKTAINNTGTLGKLYGYIVFNKTSDIMDISFNTSLRPKSNIVINNATAVRYESNQIVLFTDISVKTTGEVTIHTYDGGRGVGVVSLLPFLLFIKDFGDVITPTNGNL